MPADRFLRPAPSAAADGPRWAGVLASSRRTCRRRRELGFIRAGTNRPPQQAALTASEARVNWGPGPGRDNAGMPRPTSCSVAVPAVAMPASAQPAHWSKRPLPRSAPGRLLSPSRPRHPVGLKAEGCVETPVVQAVAPGPGQRVGRPRPQQGAIGTSAFAALMALRTNRCRLAGPPACDCRRAGAPGGSGPGPMAWLDLKAIHHRIARRKGAARPGVASPGREPITHGHQLQRASASGAIPMGPIRFLSSGDRGH